MRENEITSPRRPLACWGVVAATVCALALAVVPSASAHASLVSTDPPAGAALGRSPRVVTLRFDEGVSAVAGSLRVYDGDARRVDDGRVLRPDERSIAIGLPASLPHDTYTVAWRAISADSHPIRGAFVFSVGEPVGAGVADRVLGDEGSATVDALAGVARGVGLTGILLVLGGAVVLLGSGVTSRRGWTSIGLAALAVSVASALQIGATGAQAAGLGAGAIVRWSVVSDVIESSFGTVWAVRVAIALLVAVLALTRARRRGASRALDGSIVVLAAGIAVTPALSGHARVEGPLAVVADVAHVGAASLWVGGIVLLCLLLVEAGGDRWSLAARLVPRFSTLALASVIALVGSGILGGLLQVRSWSGLWETTYGQLLLVKAAILLGLVALGAFHRRVTVPRLRAGTSGPGAHRSFVRAAAAEIALMAVVLGVTTILVAEPPARAALATAAGPVSRDGVVGPYSFNLTVDPARTGSNEMHVYLLDSSGALAEVDEIEVSGTLPALDIGPLPLEVVRAGPGHVIVPRADLSLGGIWQITISVRKGEFDQWSSTIDINVRKDT